MRALVYDGPRSMVVRDLDRPEPGPGDVVVQVAYSGICGSELGGYAGDDGLRRPPTVFGHEISGTVVEVGPSISKRADEGPQPRSGQRVAVNPLLTCGRCVVCRTGRQQLCGRRRLLGAHLPGGNAEYVVVPADAVHVLPDGLDLATAAMVEPAACALRAVRRADVSPSSTAMVVGAGAIGMYVVAVLRLFGVRDVIVVERDPDRLAAVAGGDERVLPIGPAEHDPGTVVRTHTGGRGVDVAFDAVGSSATRRMCVAHTAPGGRVVLVGLHSAEATLPVNQMVRAEIDCLTSFAYSEDDFAAALRLMVDGRLCFGGDVRVAPLSDGPEWFERLVSGSGVAKVLLTPREV